MSIKARCMTLLLTTLLASCGGGGGGGQPGGSTPPPLTVTSSATANFSENASGTVYQATTSGGSQVNITYALSGPDAAAFSISATGAVTFRSPPDFEQPGDGNRDNIYNIVVTVTDSSGTATRDVAISVTNVPDITTVVEVGGTYNGASFISPFPEAAPVPVPAKLFVAERGGSIYVVDPATRDRGTLYLSVTGGLLSIAAAPDFATSGTLYALASTGDALELRRYGRTAAGLGDPASADVILRVPSSSASRDIGGWIGSTVDGVLFVTTGRAGTNPTNADLLGKVLRIDPTGDDFPNDPLRDYRIPNGNPFKFAGGGAPEIYASGFNDPRTAAIDENDLYVADQTNANSPSSTPLYQIRLGDAGRRFSNFPDGQPDQPLPPILRAGNTTTGAGFLAVGGIYRGQSPDLARRLIFSVQAGLPTMSYAGIYSGTGFSVGTTQDTRTCCTKLSDIVATAFGQDVRRELYFTNGSALYAIRYR